MSKVVRTAERAQGKERKTQRVIADACEYTGYRRKYYL